MYSLNSIKSQGFTILEAMVTVAIIGILSAVATPSFQSYVTSHKTANFSNDLFSDLRSLRQLSISAANNYVVCASSDSTTCLADPDESKNWSIGWIAFADLNQNNQRDSATEDILILQSEVTDAQIMYSGGGILSFNYQGEISNSQQFSICSNDDNAELGRAVLINKVGRAQKAQPSQLNTEITCN